jgi:pimeloyl-ACP methyl ester carboxylesterase
VETSRSRTLITEDERHEIRQANRSGRTPVVFVHGLWLLPSSWDRWADLFRRAGYATLTPGWPYDPETIEEARARRKALRGTPIGEVANHFERIIGMLNKGPVIIGHSVGGLLTQILAGRGLAAVSVAISPMRSRDILKISGVITIDSTIPSKLVALRLGSAVLGDPTTKHRAVPLRYDEFRDAFANAVDEDRAKPLYEHFCVPPPDEQTFAEQIFQPAAAANLGPATGAKVDCRNPDRGPMLIVAGAKDHTIPVAIARTAFIREQDNEGTTEYVEFPDRGHSLVIDDGWQEVAETALKFVGRFVS